jgi:hypothetical protein
MSKSKAPRRHKTDDELTPADMDRIKYGDGKRPETSEYREYVRAVHERAGLEPPEAELDEIPLEDMTPEEHARRRRGD